MRNLNGDKMEEIKKILIIDDEEDIIRYLETLFEDNGYKVVTADNGKDGVRKALEERPDLITLDVSMPEESGVKALREIQNSKDSKNIPVIIITGVSTDFKRFIETRKQVHPPEGYFEKPIDRDELLNKVKQLLK
jgi:DNA-binding response OmpR family regulator